MNTAARTSGDRGGNVKLTGLSRAYGANHVVSDVSLGVKSGEILALLSPFGCGKTTTLRMVAGLIQPTSGEIHIDGENITAFRFIAAIRHVVSELCFVSAYDGA